MNLKGQITEITPHLMDKSTDVLLNIEGQVAAELSKMMLKDLAIDIDFWSELKTRKANAYYWTLLNKLARKLHLTNGEMHNTLLRNFGEIKQMGGRNIYVEIPDTEENETDTLRNEKFHVMPTSEVVFRQNTTYRRYLMLKGSSELDRAGFSRLLDGLIETCKEQGIVTDTPEEIARIKALWQNK